ncbi:hypothetical protein CWO91_41050 [Bradyrhizobium genosp. SA-3]|nr:hypothetical protein CWO91_41050 [Bradyrhizobium genosp. SA-3]
MKGECWIDQESVCELRDASLARWRKLLTYIGGAMGQKGSILLRELRKHQGRNFLASADGRRALQGNLEWALIADDVAIKDVC